MDAPQLVMRPRSPEGLWGGQFAGGALGVPFSFLSGADGPSQWLCSSAFSSVVFWDGGKKVLAVATLLFCGDAQVGASFKAERG